MTIVNKLNAFLISSSIHLPFHISFRAPSHCPYASFIEDLPLSLKSLMQFSLLQIHIYQVITLKIYACKLTLNPFSSLQTQFTSFYNVNVHTFSRKVKAKDRVEQKELQSIKQKRKKNQVSYIQISLKLFSMRFFLCHRHSLWNLLLFSSFLFFLQHSMLCCYAMLSIIPCYVENSDYSRYICECSTKHGLDMTLMSLFMCTHIVHFDIYTHIECINARLYT